MESPDSREYPVNNGQGSLTMKGGNAYKATTDAEELECPK
jgi:hypothetical protein